MTPVPESSQHTSRLGPRWPGRIASARRARGLLAVAALAVLLGSGCSSGDDRGAQESQTADRTVRTGQGVRRPDEAVKRRAAETAGNEAEAVRGEETASRNGTLPEITTAALAAALASGEKLNLLDVRTPGEYGEGHIEGAVLIPNYELAKRVGEIAAKKHERWIVYCEVGARAEASARELQRLGFTDVVLYRESMRGWRKRAR